MLMSPPLPVLDEVARSWTPFWSLRSWVSRVIVPALPLPVVLTASWPGPSRVMLWGAVRVRPPPLPLLDVEAEIVELGVKLILSADCLL
jgi:hypothetical protein